MRIYWSEPTEAKQEKHDASGALIVIGKVAGFLVMLRLLWLAAINLGIF